VKKGKKKRENREEKKDNIENGKEKSEIDRRKVSEK
jgi:hypothetical protein